MSETQQARADIAETVEQLSEQSRLLVRHELDAARTEMWQKAKRSAPAVGLLGVAGLSGVFAVASAYRLGVRLLDKALPPVSAALVATAAFGAAAGAAAAAGLRQLQEAPMPFPAETAEATAAAVAEQS